jgi:2-oxoglutarate ferredoxin oxidoreductase subunit beta
MSFKGTAVLDIISPCVTFNNRDESTKSYSWGRKYEEPLHDVTWVPKRDEISIDYDAGQAIDVEMHDGSILVLKKLEQDYNPKNRMEALQMLEETCCGGELVTGLIYFNDDQQPLTEIENLIETPLTQLEENQLRPSETSLKELMRSFQ